jgi:hypothetical protein
MSSGNLIQHSYLKEAIYGELNPVGDFQAISKTGASFTGTPDITKASTVRSDRLPSGSIITGLSVNASISNELARTLIHDDFIASTLMESWSPMTAPLAMDLTYNSVTGAMTTLLGNFVTAFSVGDVFTVDGLISPADMYNLTTVFVVDSIADAINMTVTTSDTVASFDSTAGANAVVQQASFATTGQTITSYTFEKQYLDLTNKSISYLGEIFNSFSMEFNYGSPVTVSYELLGASKSLPSVPTAEPAGSRTLNGVPTEIYMNPSTSIPMLIIDGDVATSCVEGVTLKLSNGLSAKNCVGQLEKAGYDLGEASIEVTVNAHFSDSNYPFLQRILNQDTVTIAWPVVDIEGNGYYFEISCQLSADDPDVAGQDSQALLELSGSGAIGSDGNVLKVSRLGGDVIGLGALAGWTGLENCTGAPAAGTSTIKFTAPLFSDPDYISTWTFSKTGLDAQSGVAPISAVYDPVTHKVEFVVPWTTEVASGDIVTADYLAAGGTYVGASEGLPMVDQHLVLQNCFNIPTPVDQWLIASGGAEWDTANSIEDWVIV